MPAASKIIPRRVQWLWDARIALGTLAEHSVKISIGSDQSRHDRL
jgi:hypothetical protein